MAALLVLTAVESCWTIVSTARRIHLFLAETSRFRWSLTVMFTVPVEEPPLPSLIV